MSCSNLRYRVISTSHYSEQMFYRNKYKVVSFPCGKCADCTKSRQNDIAVRAAYESMNFTDITFCRLSYNDDALPLSCTPFMVFPDGTKVQDGKPFLLEGDYLVFMRKQMADVPNSVVLGKSRYLHVRPSGFEDVVGPGSYVEYTITPSVDIRDPRLWLKACRVAFKREFGYALPDFKYLMCAEYGSRYTRPHYHYLFLGLKYWQVAWMLNRWESRYGFTTVKKVKNDSKDKFRVASYISKYMAKGDFDVPAVKSGLALKGRYCASRYLGKYAIDNKRPHFLCFDVFGEYNPDTLELLSEKRPLTLSEQKTLANMIIQRMSVPVPGMDYRFPLPRSWKYLLYYKKVPKRSGTIEVFTSDDEKHSRIHLTNTFRYESFTIFKIVQKIVQDNSMSDDLRKLQEFILSLPSGTSYAEANFQFKNFKKVLSESAESHSKENLSRFYASDTQ